jgi:hypothetical protein
MEDTNKQLGEIATTLRALEGCFHYLSQRVAWSEACFQQVQQSGVMKMSEAVHQVMSDHKRLQSQVNILNLRLRALLEEGDKGDQGGAPPPTVPPTSTRRFGP